MSTPLDGQEVLNRYFLELRSKLLDVAAILDRIDRAENGEVTRADARRKKVYEALAILATGTADRAERIQLLFSRDYDPNWVRALDLEVPGHG